MTSLLDRWLAAPLGVQIVVVFYALILIGLAASIVIELVRDVLSRRRRARADGDTLQQIERAAYRSRRPIRVLALDAGRRVRLTCGHSFAQGSQVPLPAIGAVAYCPICQGGQSDAA